MQASRKLKSMGVPIVWGGIHATVQPEMCLRQDYIDYVVMGEGEATVVELANAMTVNSDYNQIKGLGYKVRNNLYLNPHRQLIENLDEYRPAWEKIEIERYYEKNAGFTKILPLITSRGCPYRCGFCYNAIINKQKWRSHSIAFMLEQVRFLKENYGIDGIRIQDDEFFINMNRAMRIVEETALPYDALSIRADRVTEDFVDWLNRVNILRLRIGAESGSQRVLDSIKKDITVEDIKRAVYLLSRSEIPTSLSFIMGLPGESKKDRDDTLTLIKSLHDISPRITTSINMYTPYPGTPLWPNALALGLKHPKDNETWARYTRKHSFLPWFSEWELDFRKVVTANIVANGRFTKSNFINRNRNRIFWKVWDKKKFTLPMWVLLKLTIKIIRFFKRGIHF